MFTKNKKTFFEHAYFPLLKLKKWFFVQESAAELPFLSSVKIIFQKFSFFYRYCRRYGCALYFVRTLYFVHPLYLSEKLYNFLILLNFMATKREYI